MYYEKVTLTSHGNMRLDRYAHNSTIIVFTNSKSLLQLIIKHFCYFLLAKEGSRGSEENTVTSYAEAKTILRQSQRESWKKQTGEYRYHQDALHKLDRKESSTIYRLRTGHCGLHGNLHRIGVADTSTCPCGQDNQTLTMSSRTALHRTRGTKRGPRDWTTRRNWGTEAEIRSTAQFITSTNLRI
jgi:hypothetical protein